MAFVQILFQKTNFLQKLPSSHFRLKKWKESGWGGKKKKSVELSSIVHFIRKTKMNYYRNFQLTGSPRGKWASDGCISKEKL